MGKQVNIHAAKTNFSKLVDEVLAGGEVTIAKAGKPVLRLVRIEEELAVPRKLGFAKHLLDAPDWEALEAYDKDFAALFSQNKFEYLNKE
jgi:prevent-host-death family protein